MSRFYKSSIKLTKESVKYQINITLKVIGCDGSLEFFPVKSVKSGNETFPNGAMLCVDISDAFTFFIC